MNFGVNPPPLLEKVHILNFFLEGFPNGLGQVVIQLKKKVRTSLTRVCVRAYQSFANLPILFGP